jgi:hypothetical protein
MNVFKKVVELVDGVEKEFVMIEINDYNNYMLLTCCSYEKLQTRKELLAKREERQQEVENKRIEEIIKKEHREQEKEDKYKKAIETEIMVNRHQNEAIKKIKENLKQDYKEVFDNNHNAKIQKCEFCNNYRVFPIHFLDDDGKKYIRDYNKDNKIERAACCVDCFLDVEQKKEERKKECSIYCNTCKSSYIAFGENAIIKHNNSTKHKKNMNISKFEKTKTQIKLELLSVKELRTICSKSLTEQGTSIITNYIRTKKDELVKNMYEVYDKLVFDFY